MTYSKYRNLSTMAGWGSGVGGGGRELGWCTMFGTLPEKDILIIVITLH